MWTTSSSQKKKEKEEEEDFECKMMFEFSSMEYLTTLNNFNDLSTFWPGFMNNDVALCLLFRALFVSLLGIFFGLHP